MVAASAAHWTEEVSMNGRSRNRSPNHEQRVRLGLALIFVAGILTFYVWFALTHLSRG
jgi:hypothetical protein